MARSGAVFGRGIYPCLRNSGCSPSINNYNHHHTSLNKKQKGPLLPHSRRCHTHNRWRRSSVGVAALQVVVLVAVVAEVALVAVVDVVTLSECSEHRPLVLVGDVRDLLREAPAAVVLACQSLAEVGRYVVVLNVKLDALLQLLAQNLFVAVSAAHGGEEEAPARHTHVQAGDDRVREPTQSERRAYQVATPCTSRS